MTEAVGNTDGSPDDGIRRMEAGTPNPRFVSGPVTPADPAEIERDLNRQAWENLKKENHDLALENVALAVRIEQLKERVAVEETFRFRVRELLAEMEDP